MCQVKKAKGVLVSPEPILAVKVASTERWMEFLCYVGTVRL